MNSSHPHLWSIGLHGGAGAMRTMSSKKESQYRLGMNEAILAGAHTLSSGGSATEAVINAVNAMEQSGAFNAGMGSCLNADGQIEVDAAVMSGHDLSIGALGAAPALGNGVQLAELIRLRSPHCLLAGQGAIRFGRDADFKPITATPTPTRLEHYHKLSAELTESHSDPEALTLLGGTHDEGDTVGAVALDKDGHLAVAVSTGGIWLKHPGRVGDSPLPGAGFWAEDGVGACAATGTGEFILRSLLCQHASTSLALGLSADESGERALNRLTSRFGWGKAGIIVIDAFGNLAFPFHTEGMGRASMTHGDDVPSIAVWPEDYL